MSIIQPATKTITGTGLPRLIKDNYVLIYDSLALATTFTSGNVTITSATLLGNIIFQYMLVIARDPAGVKYAQVTSASGAVITIENWVGGTPANNSEVQVYGVMFCSSHNTTFTALTAVDSSGIISSIAIGMRLTSRYVNAGFEPMKVYGRITKVDTTNKTLTVDAWVGATPTAGQLFMVDGWISDMPRTEKMIETFTPYQLVHQLYRGRKATKQFGYEYQCSLDYHTYISGDSLLDLKNQLQSLFQGDTRDLILVPRKDRPGTNYRVYITDPLKLSIHPSFMGHEAFMFGFAGKELVQNIMAVTGYGTNYASVYGTNL